MATHNYTTPTGNTTFDAFIGPSVGNEGSIGILHSFYLIGGHTEVPTLQDLYAIEINADTGSLYAGFTDNADGGWSTGRRRIGQTVYVIEEDKTYRLIPKGYWGNSGTLGMTSWLGLPEWDRAILIDPEATVTSGFGQSPPFPPPPVTQTGSGVAADCWVEVVGGDVKLDSTSYNSTTGELTLTMSDGVTFTETISTKHVFDINSSGNAAYLINEEDSFEAASGGNVNPTLYVTRGESYIFDNNSTGHPFRITKTQGSPDEPAGITNNDAVGPNEQVLFTIPHDAPDEYYYYCTAHASTMLGTIKVISEASGPQGLKGDQGEVGAKGDQGEVGAKGDQGEIGAKGDQGEVGAKGDQGEVGAKGDQGEVGAKGDQGDKGDQGEVGAKGDQGEVGAKGDQGDQGNNGP